MKAHMVLQVHDELLFEAPPEEVDAVRAIAKTEMESVRRYEVPTSKRSTLGLRTGDEREGDDEYDRRTDFSQHGYSP